MIAAQAPFDVDALLAQYCMTRDVLLRNRLLEQYLYIAGIVARRFSGRGVEYDDLYQVASVALLRALERFDCNRGVRFQTFATPAVIGEVRNYFRDKAGIIRLPRRSAANLVRIREARDRLALSLSRTPTPDEIADSISMPLEELLETMDAQSAMYVQSLDVMHDTETGNELDVLSHSDDAGYNRIELKDYLERVIETLSPPERDMVRQRYFLHRSQQEVAQSMNVSQMYVSRMERRVLDTFRRHAAHTNDNDVR